MGPKRTFMAMCIAFATSIAPAGAQPKGDPADPAASVPAATYRSPFAGYRPLGDEAVGDWRAANDEVGRIGGWRVYAREVQAPGDPGMGSEAPSSKTAPGAHGTHQGHGMHGGKP